MNQFKINIGDWSDDGHGEVETFLVSTAKNVEDAREAHFKIKEVTGIDIHSIVNEYEERYIGPEDFYSLLQVPGFRETFETELKNEYQLTEEKERILKAIAEDEYIPGIHEVDDEEISFEAYPDFMVKLWVFLLNLVDKDLKIKIIEEPDVEHLNFYGYDEKKRHIGFVGYGLFD